MTTDEDLFREWQRGGAGALEALVQRYYAPLLGHLTRLVADPHLAEDLMQETFVRLVRDGHTYRFPRPFRPWLYAIARHLAHNHWQSAYHRHVDVGAEPPETQAHDPDPAEWLERWERRTGLRAVLRELSFEQREVLSLRFGQELSVEETAVVVGIPVGTVKSRSFTALRRLRVLLEHTDVEEAPKGEQRHGHR